MGGGGGGGEGGGREVEARQAEAREAEVTEAEARGEGGRRRQAETRVDGASRSYAPLPRKQRRGGGDLGRRRLRKERKTGVSS